MSQKPQQSPVFMDTGAQAEALGPKAVAEVSIKTQQNSGSHYPDLLARPQRRRFKQEQILEILSAVDSAPRGEIGYVLRSYGVFSSQVYNWKKKYQAKQMGKRGKKTSTPSEDKLRAEIEELKKQNKELAEDLYYHRIFLASAKKISKRDFGFDLEAGLREKFGENGWYKS